jgi:hypothetical protein
VIGEDAAELARDLVATAHLASVKADHQAVGSERGSHRAGITGVPAVDEAPVEAGGRVLRVHAPNILPYSPRPRGYPRTLATAARDNGPAMAASVHI